MESKGKFAFLFAVIVIIGVIILVVFFSTNKKQEFQSSLKLLEEISYKENIEISLGEEIPKAEDYSQNFKGDIYWVNNNLNEATLKVGRYQGFIFSGCMLNPVTLTVVDKKSPIIKNVKDITTYVGQVVKLEEQIVVTDDSNEEIKVVVNGDYSFDKEGTYPLTYEATDTSGNVATANFKLIVKKKEVTPPITTTTKKSSKGYPIIYKNGSYYVNNILIANKTYALSSKYAPGGLSKETNAAFDEMKKDASKEGINLKIISGYRTYSHQNTLYNNYVKRDGKQAADRYSARPGHSEHQTGLAFDVNSLEQSFGDTKTGIWLSENCYKYGFILRYPKGKESITGYMYEPWHFRYIGEDAKNLYNTGNWITLEEYLGIDSKYSS